MKLEKIKLSGFKSFVDPTTIPINGNLTAIVGPNGCGKSNIIDAVRWVMGESSAKHLRGGNMADVIFNGSSGRKPVSTASVELVFNNSEGKLGGEYAQYASIAIKRQVSRDGQSQFMLNGAKCRRKDITDLFLGTGLGSRSYAIIEQGTISRMVEAKPEDLRLHIEEAAGISKYKERRGETETRMKHTRENLERLDDLREEVDKQLKHLQKQAEKAERYTALKKHERQTKLELLALRWAAYQQAAEALEATLHEVAAEYNRLFMQLRDLDAAIATQRVEHKAGQHQLDQTQGDYYSLAAEVSRLEQAIAHQRQSHQQTLLDIERTRQQLGQVQQELANDTQTLDELKDGLVLAEAALEDAQDRQDDWLDKQQDMQQQRLLWQQQWDRYRTESAKYREQAEVQRVKSEQLAHQSRQLQSRLEKLLVERGDLSASALAGNIAELDGQLQALADEREHLHLQLEQQQHSIREHRQHSKANQEALHARRSELHSTSGQITSLELLQQHAMGKANDSLQQWLVNTGLANNPRLAEYLDVQAGWETAVETVLGNTLEAVCVDALAPLMGELGALKDDSLSLWQISGTLSAAVIADSGRSVGAPRLQDKISAASALDSLLIGVYCAENLPEALALAGQLHAHESVVTRDGIWLGAGWLKISRTQDSKTGVLQREKTLRTLKQRQQLIETELEQLAQQQADSEAALKSAEQQREWLQQQLNQVHSEWSQKNAHLSAQAARLEQQQRRLQHVQQDIDSLREELAETVENLAEAQLAQEAAAEVLFGQEGRHEQLDALNQQLQQQQQRFDNAVNEARQQLFDSKTKLENLRALELATHKQRSRLQEQQAQAQGYLHELESKARQTLSPLDAEQAELREKSAVTHDLEVVLKSLRQSQDAREAQLVELAEAHTRGQRALEKHKERLDGLRFELQENQVRQQAINEQLAEMATDVGQIISTLPADAQETLWKKTADELAGQIERLGTINLSAIEEYQAQAERMAFLNGQHADLSEALQTLDQAISKIDQESRLRFKETFDKINSGLQEKFPKLFGGGQAYLELTEQNVLEAGVNIIARPPGKRNSSIHLLSGGEKALTAVALVFAIFELNPAPFCLLDEVDAPLDDANVGRFSKMVEAMSETVQFLYISHNKVTMEIAKQLAGVTMKEPGVSRMVAVDIEEAVSLAEI
ncbi:chromosome segregation protein SMC [Methylovulum psychrotolerans]|uniref:chromosome segregation protein SMC n=1 Tax=Methylovulum psychrotolerans TaxID=1704499 RepID=UPI001BFF00AD|nr:chromosome segregation protein SMC [Methylovulum psychrotolerans]MBT9099118.1 chromosome segregation protein SMC [Methylovulum psychrotolerans]